MTIEEIEQCLTEPGEYSSNMEKNAILRLYSYCGFIEYPREELKQLFKELKLRIFSIQ